MDSKDIYWWKQGGSLITNHEYANKMSNYSVPISIVRPQDVIGHALSLHQELLCKLKMSQHSQKCHEAQARINNSVYSQETINEYRQAVCDGIERVNVQYLTFLREFVEGDQSENVSFNNERRIYIEKLSRRKEEVDKLISQLRNAKDTRNFAIMDEIVKKHSNAFTGKGGSIGCMDEEFIHVFTSLSERKKAKAINDLGVTFYQPFLSLLGKRKKNSMTPISGRSHGDLQSSSQRKKTEERSTQSNQQAFQTNIELAENKPSEFVPSFENKVPILKPSNETICAYDIPKNSFIILNKDVKSPKVPFHFGFCIHNNHLYISGGDQENQATQLKSTFQIIPDFEFTTFSLVPLKDMIFSKRQHTLVAAGKYIFSLGGNNVYDSTFIKQCERYDPFADEWVEMPSLNKERKGINGLCHNNWVYAIGGITNKCINIIERLNIDHPASWEILSIKSPEYTSRCFSAGISLNKNDFLILGGFDGGQSLMDSFILSTDKLTVNKIAPLITQDHFFQASAVKYKDLIYIAGTVKPRRIHIFDAISLIWKDIAIPIN
jgi:hypothetical protein